MILSQTAYDTAGEITAKTNALSGPTTFTLSTNGTTGGLIRQATYPDGGTSINSYYADGSLKTATGTAVPPMAYVYGSDSGDQYTITTSWIPVAAAMSGAKHTSI